MLEFGECRGSGGARMLGPRGTRVLGADWVPEIRCVRAPG